MKSPLQFFSRVFLIQILASSIAMAQAVEGPPGSDNLEDMPTVTLPAEPISADGSQTARGANSIERQLTVHLDECLNRMRYLGKDLSDYRRLRGTEGYFRYIVPSGYVWRCDVPVLEKVQGERATRIAMQDNGLFEAGLKVAWGSAWVQTLDVSQIYMRNQWNDLPSQINVIGYFNLSGASFIIEVRDRTDYDYYLDAQGLPRNQSTPLIGNENESYLAAKAALQSVFARGPLTWTAYGTVLK